MGNLVIIVILLCIGVLAVRSSLKHFRGEGGCCGGTSAPRQRKTLKGARFHKSLRIEGMRCQNCANRVEGAINAIEGAAARVHLKRKTAEVLSDRQIPDEVLVRAVESVGYHVAAIAEKGREASDGSL